MKNGMNRYSRVLFIVGVIAAQMIANWGFAASSVMKVDLYSDSMQPKNKEAEVPQSFSTGRSAQAADEVTITRSSAESEGQANSAVPSSQRKAKAKKTSRK